jgi:hypothetical protein
LDTSGGEIVSLDKEGAGMKRKKHRNAETKKEKLQRHSDLTIILS